MEPISVTNAPHRGTEGGFGSYIYRPPQVPLDVERYPVAPADLELEQVHIYVRHGERTPVNVRLANPPANIPSNWVMCKNARRFQAAVAKITDRPKANKERNMTRQMRNMVERKNGTIIDGECLLGELTDLGRQSTYNYGLALRRLYINKLGFIPEVLEDTRDVYFRSTNVPRTIESLQHIVHGLYPTEKCLEQAYPQLLVRNEKDENLFGGSPSCKRLKILQLGFAEAATKASNLMLEHLDTSISKYIDGKPVRIDGKPRASGILDTIRASMAHGIPVPPEFEDQTVMGPIDTLRRNELLYKSGFQAVKSSLLAMHHALSDPPLLDKAEEVRRLAMGPLLDDLTNKMTRKIENGRKDPLKILVHCAHDTTIAGLCSTLDVFDQKWPAFTGSITFELYKRQVNPDLSQDSQTQESLAKLPPGTHPFEHYVRMRYQNNNMVLPFCTEKGKHLDEAPEFCTFKAFRERMKELIPEDWEAECVPTGRL